MTSNELAAIRFSLITRYRNEPNPEVRAVILSELMAVNRALEAKS